MGASHAKFLREVLRELTIDPSSVVETNDETLGRGSFGEVVVVKVNGSRCACKKLHDVLVGSTTQENSVVQRFVEECERLSKLHHPHIVQFLGVHFGHSPNPSLIMELLPTNLGDFLDEYKDVPSSVKHSILYDVSLGLLYLHSYTPVPIIHRDLTVNNILLTHSLKAKITDLGVARTLNITYTQRQSPMMTICPGNPTSMPPEALGDHPVYDTKLDVFSFGHIVVHVAIQKWPMPLDAEYIDPNTMEVFHRTEIERREDYISKMGGDNPLQELAVSCLQNDPSLRPTTQQLVEKTEQLSTQTPLPYLSLIDTMREIDNLSARNKDLNSQVEEKDDALQKVKELEAEMEAKNTKIVAKNAEIESLKSQLAAATVDMRMRAPTREANTQTVQSPTRESTPPTPKPRQQRLSTPDMEAQLSAAYPTPKPRKRLATSPSSLTRPLQTLQTLQTSFFPLSPASTHVTNGLGTTAKINGTEVKSPPPPSAINQTTEVDGRSNQAQQVAATAHSEGQYHMHDYRPPPTTVETARTEVNFPPVATAAIDQTRQLVTKATETETEVKSPPTVTTATNETTEMNGLLPTTHKNDTASDTKSVATAHNETGSRYRMHVYSPPPPEAVSGETRTQVKSPSSATAATNEVNGLPNNPQQVASAQKETASRVQGNRPHQKLERQKSGTYLLGAQADPKLEAWLNRRKQRENEAGEGFKELEATQEEKYKSYTLPRRKKVSELERILEKRRNKIEEPK